MPEGESANVATSPRPGPDALLAQAQGAITAARRMLTTPVLTPGLHLDLNDVARLEAFLGVSVPLTPEGLLRAVERLTAVHLGDVRIPFTPGQLAELNHRAQKRGRTLEQEMRAVVARLQDELFYQGG